MYSSAVRDGVGDRNHVARLVRDGALLVVRRRRRSQTSARRTARPARPCLDAGRASAKAGRSRKDGCVRSRKTTNRLKKYRKRHGAGTLTKPPSRSHLTQSKPRLRRRTKHRCPDGRRPFLARACDCANRTRHTPLSTAPCVSPCKTCQPMQADTAAANGQ